MIELIDRETTVKQICKMGEMLGVGHDRDVTIAVALFVQDDKSAFPTVEDRPRGEWIEVPKYKGYFVCSNCLKRLDGNFERFEHWEMKKENFCRVCGSDNRGARK